MYVFCPLTDKMRSRIIFLSLIIFELVFGSTVTGVEIPEGLTTPEGFDIRNYTGTDIDSMTIRPEISTDIPQADIEDALNLDVGKYSTISFHYFNYQNDYNVHNRPNQGRCFNDHLKCLLTQNQEAPVCAINDYSSKSGYTTLPSYCYVYLDNCRRGMRYWVTYRLGPCQWKNMNDKCVDFTQSSGGCKGK